MTVRCAIYTRKSTEEGLEQSFNSLEAQREACEAFIKSQRHEGWEVVATPYDDGGFSGGNTNRPGLKALLEDCQAGRVDTIVVYKIDRLTRSLADFAKMVELFDAHKVTFVSVTQQFNTTTSMGRLTLNVLLSFAQFEREVTGERIRDKIAASKAKGMWMGGVIPLGYEKDDRSLKPVDTEVALVNLIYQRYLELGSILQLRDALAAQGHQTKNGKRFSLGHLSYLLRNPLYLGQLRHKGQVFAGNHPAIVAEPLWQQVQQRMAENRHHHRHRTRSKEGSLLAGKLVDANGYAMSPSHSNKQGKRYRYYISQGVMRGLPMQPGTVRKIPATELENTMVQYLQQLLAQPAKLSEILPNLDLPLQQRAITLAAEWPDLPHHQRQLHVRNFIQQVKLELHQLTVTLYLSAILQAIGGTAIESDTVPVILPIKLKQIAGGATLIIQPNQSAKINQQLWHPIARAYQWNQALLKGEASTLTELAKRDGLNIRVARRYQCLAWLSPTIVELIAKGKEPAGWTLAQLYPIAAKPWAEQHRAMDLG